jgi:hypothetical protein
MCSTFLDVDLNKNGDNTTLEELATVVAILLSFGLLLSKYLCFINTDRDWFRVLATIDDNS